MLNIVTLFPEFFKSSLQVSMIKRAQEKEKVTINIYNLRDYSHNKHKKCDDYPYGGGPGMVLSPIALSYAVLDIKKTDKRSRVILFSPQGQLFNWKLAKKYSKYKSLTLVCGHYEGVDQRFIDKYVDDEISIGDYILTGGEPACLVFIDSLIRYIKGVLQNKESVLKESFSEGLLEYSQYTRPPLFKGLKVPKVLLSGNHKKIERWRRLSSLKNTFYKRPDLLNKAKLTKDDIKYLKKLETRVKEAKKT